MKIHVLQCGSIRVDPTVPFGKRFDLIEAARQLTTADKCRITLPVFTYLIEHPKGLILVDTGWCRDISPQGVYDPKAVAAVLPAQMAAFFHPFVPKGMAIHERLAGMGLAPEDLDYVLLTHLDVFQAVFFYCSFLFACNGYQSLSFPAYVPAYRDSRSFLTGILCYKPKLLIDNLIDNKNLSFTIVQT